MFKMLDHENIDEMTMRFMHIINQLKALGKLIQGLVPQSDSHSRKQGFECAQS